MPFRHVRLFAGVALLCGLLTLPTAAQEDSLTRDPADLAARLLGHSGPTPLPALTPLYELGDTLTFYAPKRDSAEPTPIQTRLAAANASVYVWVEEGLETDAATLADFADFSSNAYRFLTWSRLYDDPTALSAEALEIGVGEVIPMLDADNDPHLYIVFAENLLDANGVYHTIESLPSAYDPSNVGEPHEVIYLNTSAWLGVPLGDGAYIGLVIRAISNLTAANAFPDQPAWLSELAALRWMQFLLQSDLSPEDVNAFFAAPNLPLLQPSTLTNNVASMSARQLFLKYISQRFGGFAEIQMLTSQGSGLTGLDAFLEQAEITDPVTLTPVRSEDVFADFAVTNLINTPFGDGRYFYRTVQLEAGQFILLNPIDAEDGIRVNDAALNQYASTYLTVAVTEDTRFQVSFEGDAETELLNFFPATANANHFYWSGDAPNHDHTMTRAFDLSGLDSASLAFDAWHDLSAGWNYVYVEVSTDDGASWTALPADSQRRYNPYGAAYGPGFTGISSPQLPRPFPYMGVSMDPDGVTILEAARGGAAERAGIQANDVIIGYNGEPWPEVPNLLTLLTNYSPGDTLDLWIQRGDERLSIPLLLDAHPTRILIPDALWQRQHVDLTPYVGGPVLLRFEYVSLPQTFNTGFAIDNLTIPELDYEDDAETSTDWTLHGWEQRQNQVEQRFTVQAVTASNTVGLRVERLLSPGEGTSGRWEMGLSAGERMFIVVSALSPGTTRPAQYDFSLTAVEQGS